MYLTLKISLFLHILSAMLIAVSAFGFPVVESSLRKENSFSLHKLSLNFSRLARVGGILAIITGIYNWISIGGAPGWLIVKLILFLWFVISGIFVGVKYISKRESILESKAIPSEELLKINKAIETYAYVNLAVFIVIVFLAVFKPF
ncbi:Predicted integral membrane protein (DUF2269) [Candidatus Kryptonium thompsonii]|jgi:uncharacterized membrane protein|uniref:Predicted integral membrane protein (DUF2269) n=1 Tax=Candidatus Kryptonium thompsonii TaxID=1633631 RepID=A0A0N7MUY1_9BACT|nr:DUF2269 family protein [Candidatus Kryptonium thompsoni]CUS79342.1 Predicted integral membrane protein (DUF2269) [Candidatus Kryptonium thompsoni]CUS83669.1 Predicted integral membrane protein (DUF2269) [Candidatus Kryptonium thompsoni]CUS87419.1 Predicted integral membrane protein (DUF2269) [Candidatus Kryptonium thompsoni]CUS94307.1 Predicted integral membrane protein (DUF2269) [Candidatus Kryptonium thompsoni]CUU08420.1 Predicted integral membrane protein (DUF2269) [Candidatus Kryptonium